MLDLVTMGEAFDDFVFYDLSRLPHEGEEMKTDAFVQAPGGGVVITAIAASRLGLACGAVGGFSSECVRRLRAEHVRVTNLRRLAERSALTVALSSRRDRRFITFPGVNSRLAPRLLETARGLRARHVHIALVPPRCRPWIAVVDALRRRGATTSWDFGWSRELRGDPSFAALVARVDYLFLNRDEAILYSHARSLERAVDRWRTLPNRVVIKLGAGGSRLVGGGLDVRARGRRVRAVDTTGAGDAFNASFLAAILSGGDARQALDAGNRVGALSTRRAGGIDGLPARRRERAALHVGGRSKR